MPGNPVRVLAVSPQPLLADLLSRFIDGESGLQCVAAAHTTEETICRLFEHHPDVVVLLSDPYDRTSVVGTLREALRRHLPAASLIESGSDFESLDALRERLHALTRPC